MGTREGMMLLPTKDLSRPNEKCGLQGRVSTHYGISITNYRKDCPKCNGNLSCSFRLQSVSAQGACFALLRLKMTQNFFKLFVFHLFVVLLFFEQSCFCCWIQGYSLSLIFHSLFCQQISARPCENKVKFSRNNRINFHTTYMA